MENTFGVNDILTGRGLGLGGFGYGYGAGHGTYAGPTANAIRTECVGDKVEMVAHEQSDAAIRAQIQAVSGKLSEQSVATAIGNGNTNLFFAQEMAAMRAESAKCCCETQKLIAAEACKTREAIAASDLATITRELGVQRDRVIQLETIAALSK